jgi:hypothetical protein
MEKRILAQIKTIITMVPFHRDENDLAVLPGKVHGQVLATVALAQNCGRESMTAEGLDKLSERVTHDRSLFSWKQWAAKQMTEEGCHQV